MSSTPRNKEDPARGDERGLQVGAEALTRPARPGRRRGRKLSRSLSVGWRSRTNAGSERLPCIFCKLPRRGRAKPRRRRPVKEKRPHPKMGPERSGQSPNRKCGRRTREEETPSAGGPSSREEERSSVRLSQSRPEGGGYGPRHIDKNEYADLRPFQQCG